MKLIQLMELIILKAFDWLKRIIMLAMRENWRKVHGSFSFYYYSGILTTVLLMFIHPKSFFMYYCKSVSRYNIAVR